MASALLACERRKLGTPLCFADVMSTGERVTRRATAGATTMLDAVTRNRNGHAARRRSSWFRWHAGCSVGSGQEYPVKTILIIGSLFLVGVVVSTGLADTAKPTAPKRIEIFVTTKGFEPGKIEVPAAQPITLVFTRRTDRTCAKRVVIQLGDGKKVEKDLPLDISVEVPVTFAKKGELAYACAMDMITGVILVQ